MKILVVEDSMKLARFLSRVLTEEGFAVDLCQRGSDALEQAQHGIYDLIVLDWMLPEVDGISVCRSLRRSGNNTPILMLTARGETRERVLGLDSGADDYLVKPFEVEELVARINALLRRASGMVRLRFDDLEIDKENRRVIIDGEPVALTLRESQLLLHLVHRLDRVTTRSELLAQVWNTSFDPGSNVLEVHISRLREKLGKHAWRVATVRGAGYVFRSHEPP
ncbi:MAG: response regulator transcription factor [Myxococcales bacterium]|jgi:DNA-binding response OmpR family regulator|nr:response regulator transcription factor [Myxococcales bacterium]